MSSPPRGSSARRKLCSSTPSHPMSEQNSNASYARQREPHELVVGLAEKSERASWSVSRGVYSRLLVTRD
jgi:hypothetical protein